MVSIRIPALRARAVAEAAEAEAAAAAAEPQGKAAVAAPMAAEAAVGGTAFPQQGAEEMAELMAEVVEPHLGLPEAEEHTAAREETMLLALLRLPTV